MNSTKKDNSSHKRTWLLVLLLLLVMLLVLFMASGGFEQEDVPEIPQSEEVSITPTATPVRQDAPMPEPSLSPFPDNLSAENAAPVNTAAPQPEAASVGSQGEPL